MAQTHADSHPEHSSALDAVAPTNAASPAMPGQTVGTGKTPNRPLLFLAYGFPPLGGPGVQRALKTVKYLPEFGWDPVVVTVKDVLYYAHDESLMAEIPGSARVVRTETLDPLRVAHLMHQLRPTKGANQKKPSVSTNSPFVKLYRLVRDLVAFPDAHAGWIPFCYTAGLRALRESGAPVIYTAGTPYSSMVAAYMLWRTTGIPYVIDFRDGWTDDSYGHQSPTPLHLAAQRQLERLIVPSAAAIVTVVPELTKRLTERYPSLQDRAFTVTNGFDPADAAELVPAARTPGIRRIVYAGSLHEHHKPNYLTFLQALRALPQSLAETIEVVFVGTSFVGAEELAREIGVATRLQFLGYQPHVVALSYLLSADASLLFIRPGDRDSVTGKVFEYIMAGRPILAGIEDHGQCGQILDSAGLLQWRFDPTDVATAAAHLRRLDAEGWPRPLVSATERFSRRAQAGQFAAVFAAAAAGSALRHATV